MFDFTESMDRLIRHISVSSRKFKHVQPDRLLVAYIQTRSPGIHGVYASCQPLRFKNGEVTTNARGRTYSMPKIVHDGREMLYILYFALPRFMNLDFEAKMTTVFHELYHISPEFNGDIRRFKGKNYAHGHSRRVYNERMKALADDYLSRPDADEYTAFLRMDFEELSRECDGVTGRKISPPKPQVVK
jgi:predicted metallopeptidase